MSRNTRNGKTIQKNIKANGKVTDFFQRLPPSSPSSSQPSVLSPPSQPKLGTKPTIGQSGLKVKKDNVPARPDQEVISISSDNTHISISSDSVVCLSSPPLATKNKLRVVMEAVEIVSSPRSKAASVADLSVPPHNSNKRSGSPEPRMSSQVSLQKTKSRSPSKRKKKFESDSEYEPLDSVVQVPKTVARPNTVRTPILVPRENLTTTYQQRSNKPSPNKKLKVAQRSAPECETKSIPSSQSDEQELALPKVAKKDVNETKENVDKWLKEASLEAGCDGGVHGWLDQDMGMNIDVTGVPADIPTTSCSSSAVTPHSETEVSVQLRTSPATTSTSLVSMKLSARQDVASFRSSTPPPNDLPPLPSTPVAVDGDSKAAHIIAQIKAQAYANSASSSEGKTRRLELRELSDSSSDEDDYPIPWKPRDKGKGKRTGSRQSSGSPLTPLSRATSTTSASIHASSSRSTYSRLGSPSTGRRVTRSNGRTMKPPPRVPVTLTQAKERSRPQKKKGDDPLARLLKEKQAADKRGRGMTAIRDAEDALGTSPTNQVQGKDRMKLEMDDEDMDTDMDGYWGDEDAAYNAIRQGERLGLQSSSPNVSPARSGTGSDEDILDDKDRLRLLGEKSGKAVGKILEKDREQRRKGKAATQVQETHAGVALWETHATEDIEMATPELSLDSADVHPVLQQLKIAVDTNNVSGLTVLLETGIIAVLQSAELSRIIPWLCELALSPTNLALGEFAFRSLLSVFVRSQYQSAKFFVPLMLSTMMRLGAKSNTVEALGLDIPVGVGNAKVDDQERADILFRLVALASQFAERGAVPSGDIPDLIVLLMLIAFDFSTSSELQRQVTVVIDRASRPFSKDLVSSVIFERATCDKLLKLVQKLGPNNKAYLFRFLACGCPAIGRIARWVAHVILVTANNVSPKPYLIKNDPSTSSVSVPTAYSPYPALENLTAILSPPVGSGGLFDMSNANIDYEDFGHYVDILSVALTDIEGYVAEERLMARQGPAGPSSQDSPEPNTPLKAGQDRGTTPLERIKDLIIAVHGKIVDTRAAHLDRSRAKAALQRLAMRVHYQRLVALKAGPSSAGVGPVRPRTLRDHWNYNP